MSVFTTKANVVITCHKRIVPYLEQEVLNLGFEIEERFVTGLKLFITLNDCIKLNLNLRCASQVLYSLQAFKAIDAQAIYSELVQMPWEEIIPDPGYFSVTSNVSNESINNSMFANLRVKDAIVDRLRDIRTERPKTGAALTRYSYTFALER